jgi:hypothetical protein
LCFTANPDMTGYYPLNLINAGGDNSAVCLSEIKSGQQDPTASGPTRLIARSNNSSVNARQADTARTTSDRHY